MTKIENGPCRVVLTFALALFSVFGSQFSIAQSRDSLIVHYTDGVRLAAGGRPAEALEKFRKALEVAPDHDPSLYEAAKALLSMDRQDEALEYSARAVTLAPDNSWYRGQHGRLFVALESYDSALALFEEIVASDPDHDPDDYRLLAMLYYKKGRIDDALTTLDRAGVRMGATSTLVEMKRALLIEAGRIDEAAAVTEAYVAQSPYDETNRLALAGIYAWQGRDSLHLATLKQVVEINPDNPDALDALADAYMARGRGSLYLATLKQLFTLPKVPLARKMERLETVAGNVKFYRTHFFEVGELALLLVTMYPADPGVVEFYADHAARGGDAESALVILKNRLLRPDPPLSTFRKTIQIEAWKERSDSVALYSDRALRLFPGEVQIYLLKAGALQYLKRPREAQKTLSQALKAATTDSLRSEVWGTIGTLWHEEGNEKKTFSAYEKALSFYPDNALVLNNYAYFLALEGRELDRALGMARRAVRLQENFATYLDTYAWVLYKTGDYAGAKRVMQQALPLDREGSAELMMHYGDILWALGEKFMASVYWKRARDAGYDAVGEIEERLSRIE